MKRIIEIALFAGILLMTAGCSDNDNSSKNLNQPPPNSGDCWYSKGFVETYRDCIKDEEVYFVMGEITAAGSYGLNIKIMEDLKGNFKGGSSITLWNHWEFGVSDLKQGTGTILLVLMSRIDDDSSAPWSKERQGDYLTIGCSTSILSFSEGNVTGRINTNGEEMTVQWKNLQERLPSACQSDMDFAENWNANINMCDVFFIKGVVVQEFYSYGIKIKPVKDLKGNFPDNPVIGVWGKGDLSNCVDILCTYRRDTAHISTDTLYMLIRSVIPTDVPYSDRKEGDYVTIDCAHSIVPVNRDDSKLVALREENGAWMTVEEFEDKFEIKHNL